MSKAHASKAASRRWLKPCGLETCGLDLTHDQPAAMPLALPNATQSAGVRDQGGGEPFDSRAQKKALEEWETGGR